MNATITQWLNGPLAQDIGGALAHSLWQGGAVALAVAILLRWIPSRQSTLRYWTSCGGLMAIVLASAATFALLLMSAGMLTANHRVTAQRVHATPAAQDPAPAPALNISDNSNPISPALPFTQIVALWIVGVALFAIWHACGWVWLLQLRRGHGQRNELARVIERLSRKLKIKRRVLVVESGRVDGPWVVGLLKPVILVPLGLMNDLSPQQVEAILAHELAHVRRHDYLVNLLQAAVETLLFYHPAVWWVSNQIRQERENCCDDVAAELCGSPTLYVESLLAIEQRRHSFAARLALAASGGQMAARARRLLAPANAHTRRDARARSLAVAGLAIACVIASIALTGGQGIVRAATPTTSTITTGTLQFLDFGTFKNKNISAIKPEDLQAETEDYKIAPNDLVTISVTDLVGPGVETVKSVRVSEKGNITMPMLDKPIKVTGISEQEAEKAIAKAYRDMNLIANPQISLSVKEARGRTFSILGQIERPGQYQITQADFRVLDALTLSAAKPDEMAELYVIRGKDKDARMIPVPVERLTAGDLSVNIVIRPNDMLIAPRRERKFIRVTVTGPDQLSMDGKPISWAELDKKLTDISAAERKHTVLELAVGAPDMPVSQYFEVESKLTRRVKDYGMDYFSNVGIDRAATRPAAAADTLELRGNQINFSGTTITGVLSTQPSEKRTIILRDGTLNIDNASTTQPANTAPAR